MSWLALHRCEEAEALLQRHPNAFLLLTQIAMRARYQPGQCPVTKLLFGQAQIGDFESAGLPSRQAYRVAQQKLLECGFATFQGTNKGTIATLSNSIVYSISSPSEEPSKEPTGNHQGTIKEPLTNKDTKKQGNKGHATEPEIVAFVKDLGLPESDGTACFDKWTGNGWKNGGKAIVDWKATIRSWKAQGYLPSQKYGDRQNGSNSKWKTD